MTSVVLSLGRVFADAARLNDAADSLKVAISLRPNLLEAVVTLGTVLLSLNRVDEAVVAHQQSIKLNPNFAEAYTNLGNAFRASKRLDEAVAAYRRAVHLKPDLADAHYNLAIVLKQQQLLEPAKQAFQRVVELQPRNVDAYNNLGIVLQLLGEIKEAEEVFCKALALNPASAHAHNNLGKLAHDAGRFGEAIAAYQRAIAVAPHSALVHYNYGLTLLMQGDFQRGWKEFEWRRKALELEVFCQDFPQQIWDGSDLNGRTLLIHSEQGFGDAIQFSRYVPIVAPRGGRIVFQCHPQLNTLFQCLNASATIVPIGQPLPAFDVHAPLLSLPRILKTELSNIPASVPYLHADAALVQEWQVRLEPFAVARKVGVVWAGRPHPPGRSIPFAALSPLAAFPGISFISLQMGERAKDVSATSSELQWTSLSEEIRDFADTAAILKNLDLLITFDTATAHLAGALGIPTWLLLSHVPDWRWLIGRNDSPWYPTIRIFRNSTSGDWRPTILDVVDALGSE